MNNIIITGGCGFIASNFIEYILDKYSDIIVTNIDALTSVASIENTESFKDNPRYSFIQANILEKEKISPTINKGDTIIHFAAESHVDNSIKDATPFTTSNVLGTQILLDIAKEKQVKKFIYISTDEVYGSLNYEDPESKETDLLKPSSPYSASKAGGDLMCQAYARTHNVPIIIVRPSNNFGPRQFPEKIIPFFISKLLKGENVPLYGNGKNIRDWLYVKDTCKAVDLLRTKGEIGQIYNVGGENYLTNIALTKKLISSLNLSEDRIEYVKDRLGHDIRYAVNSDKIKALGFKTEHNFEEALQETITWYKNNLEYMQWNTWFLEMDT